MPSRCPSKQSAEVTSMLVELGDAVRRHVARAIRAGQPLRTTEVFHVWRAHYSEGALAAWRDQETRVGCNWPVVQSLVEAFSAERRHSLERAALALTEAARVELPEAQELLVTLMRLVARDAVQRRRRSSLQRLVQRFLHEVSGGDLSWKVTTWLCGISPDGEISIGEGLLLRRPRSRDLDVEVPSESTWPFSPPSQPIEIPDAILEVKARSRQPPTTQQLRQIAHSFCLFRLGSVAIMMGRASSDSLLRSPHAPWSDKRPSAHILYPVSRGDGRRLRRFVARVAPLLPPNPTGVHSDPRSGARSIGLKQYFRALHEASDAEERIALGVAALEGLLVGKDEGELSHRLAQRTASLLSLAGLNGVEVYSRMKKAYDLRSSHVHGMLSTSKSRTAADSAFLVVLEYARLALVKYLETDRWHTPRTKEGFLKDLDESLLDPTRRQALRQELSGGLWRLASPQAAPDSRDDRS